jgi:hypothetical protein
MQLLCPTLHPIEDEARSDVAAPGAKVSAMYPQENDRITALETRVAQLEVELKELKSALG